MGPDRTVRYAVEAVAGILRADVEIIIIRRLQLFRFLSTQGFAVCGGVGVLGPEFLVAVQGRGLDLPGEIAAGSLLRALYGDADGLHGVVEEQGCDVEAHAQAPLEIGDVESLVLFRILQIAAHGHGNGDAGLYKELELQKLNADADTGLQLNAGCNAQAVKYHLAAGAGHRPQVLRGDLPAQGGQPDIDGFVVGLQQNLLLRAVAGQRSRIKKSPVYTVQAGIVKDFHVDRTEEINVEASNRILSRHVQLKHHGTTLSQTAKAALAEGGNFVAQLRIADTGQGRRYLHLNAQLHVDVGQGEGAEAVLDGELNAKAGGKACRFEEVAVVDGIILEHDGDLHREADLHLGGRAVAVLGVFEAVVLKCSAHKILDFIHFAGLTGAYKVCQGLHLSVCLTEALLEILARGFLRVVLRRRRRIVVLGFFAGAYPLLLFAVVFLLLGHVFIGLVTLVIRHDSSCLDRSDFTVILIRCGGDVRNGFAILGRNRLVMDFVILIAC